MPSSQTIRTFALRVLALLNAGVTAIVFLHPASAWGEAKRSAVPAELAAREYEVYLKRIAKTVAPRWPAHRIEYGADVLVFSATAAHALAAEGGPGEWAGRLYGEKTDGRKAFDIVTEFLNGRFDRVLELPKCFGEAELKSKRATRWGPIADLLDSAAGTSPDRQNWRDAATALRMAGFVRGAGTSLNFRQLDKYQEGSEQARKALAAAAASIATAESSFRSPKPMHVPMFLRRAMYEKRLTDPYLIELLQRLTPDAGRRTLVAQKVAGYAPKQAVRAAAANLDAHPDEPEAVNSAAKTLVRADRRDEAIKMLREAEKRIAYPDKREIRFRLFGLLMNARDRQMKEVHPEPRKKVQGPLARFPLLVAELERLESAEEKGAAGPGESQMARGDLFWVAMDRKRAETAYGKAFEQAQAPGLKYAAWVAYAQCAPAGAWEKVHEVVPLFAGDAPPVPCTEFLDKALLAGIAAGEVDAALTWVMETLSTAQSLEPDAGLMGKLIVLLLVTDQSEAARDVLKMADGDYQTAKVLGRILDAGTADRAALLGRTGTLTQAADAALGDQLDVATVWYASAAFATDAVKEFQYAGPVAGLWGALAQNPPLANPTEREATLAALARYVDTALEWVDSRPEKETLPVTNLLGDADTPLRGKHALVVLPECQRLFATCLQRGAARSIEPRVITPLLKAYRNSLQRCKAPADATAFLREAVATHYPGLLWPEQ